VLRFLHRVRSIATRMLIIQGNACVVLNIVLYHIFTFISAWIIQNSKVQETHVRITTFYSFQSSYSIPVTAYLDDDTSNFMYLKNVKTDKVSRVTKYIVWLRAWRPGDRGSIIGRGERIFPVSRPALRPTQPPIEWVPGSPFPELKRGRVVTLTTHSHLVSRSRMSRSYTSSPPKRLRGV
jgi:hypothetical protein